MDYVIASIIATDEILFHDAQETIKAIGGAGIYALTGIKCWTDQVLAVTGVGADFDERNGDWFRQNHLSMEGLIVKGEKTPHTLIHYFEDGERKEKSMYGSEHFRNMEVTAQELAPYFQTAKGIYIFKNSSADFWEEILRNKANSRTKVLWEIANDATQLDNLEFVKRIAEQMEVFSINLSESKKLLGTEDLSEIIEAYQSWKTKMVFLRRGSKGAIMIGSGQAVEVPAAPMGEVIDPTGGGNSSSGAVLYGFCEDYSLEDCGRMGSLASAVCLSQYGVPDRVPRLSLI
ncbi:MAG: carbohydrate kinase family protein [Tissierellia bacterium]|nr:carbohydrate kinase family protein [Tissierellia bacterium]